MEDPYVCETSLCEVHMITTSSGVVSWAPPYTEPRDFAFNEKAKKLVFVFEVNHSL